MYMTQRAEIQLENICTVSRSSNQTFTSEFHCHDFWEIFAYLDGNLVCYVEDRVYRPVFGDILVIPPGKMHQVVLTESAHSYERFVVHLMDSYLRKLEAQDPDIGIFVRAFRGGNQYLLSFIGEEAAFVLGLLSRLTTSQRTLPGKLSLLCELIYSLRDAFADRPNERGQQEDDLVSGVIQYINSCYTEQLNLDTLSAQFYVSKSYLNRRFRQYTQLTIYDYILTKRIGLARRLLQSGIGAHETAVQCGFADYSSFYRTFIRKTGCTPKDFKQMHGAEFSGETI